MDERRFQKDEEIASLIGALAEQYRQQVGDADNAPNGVRLEIVRKLMLIADSIKGLMKTKARQLDMEL